MKKHLKKEMIKITERAKMFVYTEAFKATFIYISHMNWIDDSIAVTVYLNNEIAKFAKGVVSTYEATCTRN